MKPLTFMLIAGEASGDTLGAELVTALRSLMESKATVPRPPRFFGVGGPQMQAAGVEIIYDFTRDAVWGLEALKRLLEFRRRFQHLLRVAIERQPDVIICVDFAGFNRRFAHAVKSHLAHSHRETGWAPKIVQYVSPQVWASRPGRAARLAEAVDLLLAIFPFEKAWYAKRVPGLRVEFVGHPIIDRYAEKVAVVEKPFLSQSPTVVLLPGSRPTELKRHLPIILQALEILRRSKPNLRAMMVLSDRLARLARELGLSAEVEVRAELAAALREADLAIAKSGTVTLECAYFGVPAVVMYQTSALTYAVGKRIVNVKWVAMPNILANEELFPEFIQSEATGANLGRAALELLDDERRRNNVKAKLRQVAASLGSPGASRRAAAEIMSLLEPQSAASSVVAEQT